MCIHLLELVYQVGAHSSAYKNHFSAKYDTTIFSHIKRAQVYCVWYLNCNNAFVTHTSSSRKCRNNCCYPTLISWPQSALHTLPGSSLNSWGKVLSLCYIHLCTSFYVSYVLVYIQLHVVKQNHGIY